MPSLKLDQAATGNSVTVSGTSAASLMEGVPTNPPVSVASDSIIPSKFKELDIIDLSMHKKAPPTQKTGKPLLIDDYDDTLGKADPGQEIERFKADVQRQTDVRIENLDVYLENNKLYYRIRSKGVAGEIHFRGASDEKRIREYVSGSYSKVLMQLGQKEWTYVVGGGVTPRYNVGTNKTTVGTGENFQVTKLYENGQQINLRGYLEQNGFDNMSFKLMVDASDPFWGKLKDLGVTVEKKDGKVGFKFDNPHIGVGDEIQDGLRDRALGLLKKAFLDGDPVALSEIGAAVGLVVGAGALLYSGALNSIAKNGVDIPLGLNMNIIKTGRQKIGVEATPVISIGDHKLDLKMKDAGLKYELNHKYFLFKADGAYQFEEKTIKSRASVDMWGNRANINVEHINGLGDAAKTTTKFGAGVGGPINTHLTWHADYSGTLDGQGHYAGSSVGGRLAYNTGGFQSATTITLGAGVDGLGVSKDAISPYVSLNVQKKF